MSEESSWKRIRRTSKRQDGRRWRQRPSRASSVKWKWKMKRRNRDVYTSVIYPQFPIPHPCSPISLQHITRSVTRTLVCASSVPAMITSHPNTTMARKGQTKELNCTARGEQPIIIRWERGDTVIDAERNPRYSITINKKGDEVISTLKVLEMIQTLLNRFFFLFLSGFSLNRWHIVNVICSCFCSQLNPAERGDSVFFSCHAINSYGEGRGLIQLTVQGLSTTCRVHVPRLTLAQTKDHHWIKC